MISNACIEAAVAELRACNIEPTVRHGGKHVAIEWSHNGENRTFTAPATPSDHRAHLNTRTDIRRMLRNDGLIAADEVSPPAAPQIVLRNGKFFCDSRDIAFHFGKQHKDVLRSIDKALEELGDFAERNFTLSEYRDSTGRPLRCFSLSRDGFSYIAMGFTGAKAADWKVKYLTAFNAMEDELKALSSALPSAVMPRIEKLEGDMSALIDLCFSQPQPEPGFIIIKAHKRRVRGSLHQ
ncbi:MAG: Rha family transcriptional regulator [Hyphomicrobium sp.]